LITIQVKTTKKDGRHTSVSVSSSEGVAFERERKFASSKSARKYVGRVNRRQKLYGKRFYMASAIEKKHNQVSMESLTDKLKEKFNNEKV